jgi:hypothetical protein
MVCVHHVSYITISCLVYMWHLVITFSNVIFSNCRKRARETLEIDPT